MKYGTIPAGGLGVRLQPIGFSKELLPCPPRRHRIFDRADDLAGITKIFINTAGQTDLDSLPLNQIPTPTSFFLVRPRRGLLDGIILPQQFLREDDELYFGLPDTIWYPKDGFAQLDKLKGELVLGLFDTGTQKNLTVWSLTSKTEFKQSK